MGQSRNSQVCGNCGTFNSPQDQFCSKCGYLLASGPPDKTFLATTMSAPVRRVTGALVAGVLLGNRYRIVHLIGKGGFGAVYKATDERFQSRRTIAIKEMSDGQLNPAEKAKAIQDFRNEAGLLVELSHPNLPMVSDFFEDGGKVYLVMEFIEGKTLETIKQESGGKLDTTLVMGWALQLCEVLHYLHTRPQPIIFRDMKPSNVMVTADGRIKLIDFGIARIFKAAGTKDTTLLGSHGYAPLEQYGRGQSDARSDIYALGATLYELLTDELPADAPSRRVHPDLFIPPSQLNPKISPEIEAIILNAMADEPQNRYQSAADMYQAIVATGIVAATNPSGPISNPLATKPTGQAPTRVSTIPNTAPALMPKIAANKQTSGPPLTPLQGKPPVSPQLTPSPSSSGPSRRAFLITGLVGAAAVGTGLYFFLRPKANTINIPFIYSTEKDAWMQDVINDFNNSGTMASNRVIQIHATSEGSVKTKTNILDGIPTADGRRTPVAWSPASDLELNQLLNSWQKKNNQEIIFTSGDFAPRLLVESPLVFAVWRDRAHVLLQNYSSSGKNIDWPMIYDAVQKKSWGDIGGNSNWGPVKLGQTRPDSSNSGLLTITLLAYSHYQMSRGLTVAQVTDTTFLQYFQIIEGAVQKFGRSSGTYLEQEVILNGPSSYDIVMTYENLVLTMQNEARQRWNQSLLPFYPSVNITSNHPFAIFKGNGITQLEQEAAMKFRDFLLDVPQQHKALLKGFRPTNSQVALTEKVAGNPFTIPLDNPLPTVQIAAPLQLTNLAAAPNGDVIDTLMQQWLTSYDGAPTALSISPDSNKGLA
jgi:serine/threonine protein kinase